MTFLLTNNPEWVAVMMAVFLIGLTAVITYLGELMMTVSYYKDDIRHMFAKVQTATI